MRKLVRSVAWLSIFGSILGLASCSEEPTAEPKQAGTIWGSVADSRTSLPVPGVTIATDPPLGATATNAAGEYRIAGVPPQSYAVIATKPGYFQDEKEVRVESADAREVSFLLSKDETSPALTVEPMLLDFGEDREIRSIQVSNLGETALHFAITSTGYPWVTFAEGTGGFERLLTGTLGANVRTIFVRADRTGLEQNLYTPQIVIDAGSAGSIVVDCQVIKRRTNGPLLCVFPLRLDLDNQSVGDLSIINCGSGDLRWQISESVSWLEVDQYEGLTTERSTVRVSVNRSGLAPDLYETQLRIASNDGEGERFVDVKMRVGIDPTQIGACCGTSECRIDSRQDCRTPSVWLGSGSTCDPDPCTGSLGACCFRSGSCASLSRIACVEASGGFEGSGSTCDPNPCAPPPPRMVRVPAGSFRMGDAENGGFHGCSLDEREVTLTTDFELGITEVTNQQFSEALSWALARGYIGFRPNQNSPVYVDVVDNLDGSDETLFVLDFGRVRYEENRFLVDEGKEDFPVFGVTWFGAAAYCDWLSIHEGLPRSYDHSTWSCNDGNPYGALGYRLPTDAEWEYAAQFNDDRTYPWGNSAHNCSRSNSESCLDTWTPVSSYPSAPAELGLYDMTGNVFEFCDDVFECRLGTEPVQNPSRTGGLADRVGRGGGWRVDPAPCAWRSDYAPSYYSGFHGFRVARSILPGNR